MEISALLVQRLSDTPAEEAHVRIPVVGMFRCLVKLVELVNHVVPGYNIGIGPPGRSRTARNDASVAGADALNCEDTLINQGRWENADQIDISAIRCGSLSFARTGDYFTTPCRSSMARANRHCPVLAMGRNRKN